MPFMWFIIWVMYLIFRSYSGDRLFFSLFLLINIITMPAQIGVDEQITSLWLSKAQIDFIQLIKRINNLWLNRFRWKARKRLNVCEKAVWIWRMEWKSKWRPARNSRALTPNLNFVNENYLSFQFFMAGSMKNEILKLIGLVSL